MNQKLLWIVVGLLLLPGCTYRCFHPVKYDADYRGRVIDAETREPLEGVVVLGVWYSQGWSPGGGVSTYYDARETVTGKNGEFTIPGKGLRILSNLDTIQVLIFKKGYEHVGMGPWVSFKEDSSLRKKVEWEGDMVIVPIRKMSLEERKKRIIGKENIPGNKQKKLIREINREALEAKGFSIYTEVADE